MSSQSLPSFPHDAIVECVPNFSEGRDAARIESIVSAMREVAGVSVLDVDPGAATNRTVVTMVGPPAAVVEAAFRGIAAAQRLIDMRAHSGAHPRIGATDVCPFVPVRGLSLEDCAAMARHLGARVGAELGIPVYLYERAASRPERENLADVRQGEWEGLPDKLSAPAWAPDFGPSAPTEAVLRSGATVIGARPFLIAFNVNLNTANVRKANKIGALIREKGIYRKDADLNIIRGEDGKGIRDPGMFRAVKAIGWYIEEYGRCQVSINFTDHQISPVHDVVDAIRRVADQEGVVVTGCELVGLIPLDAMLAAGRHYLRRQGANPGAPDAEVIEVAIRSLGLRDLGPFDPNQAIIERRIASDGPLVRDSLRGFMDRLSSAAPAPGGGSIAALCGALSVSLSAMVAQLTSGKKGHEHQGDQWDALAVQAQRLKEAFLTDVDADTAAFDAIMAAFSLPKDTDAHKAARRAAVQSATLGATLVPLRVLQRSVQAIEAATQAAAGNRNARSDAGVAGLTARAAAEGAYYNVLINASGLADKARAAALLAEAEAAWRSVVVASEALSASVRVELGGPA
jgi:glutamate formiminotransferase/formiminotetrahydrofolate cyclodeaminase